MTMPPIPDLSQAAASGIKTLHRFKNAMVAPLWLVAVVGITFFPAAYAFSNIFPWLAAALVATVIVVVLVAVGIMIFFALKKPEKLQSEDYQIQQERLDILRVQVSASPLSTRVNEALLRLLAAERGNE
jgi:hypothetical protein